MATRVERFIRRGPFPGEEPDLTAREGGWHYLALGLAVALTLLSVVVMVTWPFAILAWVLVAGLWILHVGAKKWVCSRNGASSARVTTTNVTAPGPAPAE